MQIVLHISESGISNTAAWERFQQQLKPGKWLVSAKSFKKRSNNQNKYYHGCMVPLVKQGLIDMGWDIRDEDEAHEFIKEKFLRKKIVNKETGEVKEIPGSTAKLTTVQFNELIEDVIRFGAEYLGIQIPYPSEQIAMYE